MRDRIGEWLESRIEGVHENFEETEALFKVMGACALTFGNVAFLYEVLWNPETRSENLLYMAIMNAVLLYVYVPWTRVRPMRGRTVDMSEALGLGMKFGWLFCAAFASALVYETPSLWWVLLLPLVGGIGVIAMWLGQRWGSALVVTASFWVWTGVPLILFLTSGDLMEKGAAVLRFMGVALPAAAIGFLAHRQGEAIQ